MSIKLMTAAWDIDLPHADKLVLWALAANANDVGHCWPGPAWPPWMASAASRIAALVCS